MTNQIINENTQQLMEATQSAVIDTVGELETVLQQTAQEFEAAEPFYLSGEFWVAMAFVLVVVALFVPIKKALFAFLGNYIQQETMRIEDAAVLKDEARKILADYEQKFENVAVETKNILIKAQRDIESLENKEMSKLNNKLNAQEKMVADKVAAQLAYAEKELSSIVADKSIFVLEKVLSQKLNDDNLLKLIDQSISKIEKL